MKTKILYFLLAMTSLMTLSSCEYDYIDDSMVEKGKNEKKTYTIIVADNLYNRTFALANKYCTRQFPFQYLTQRIFVQELDANKEVIKQYYFTEGKFVTTKEEAKYIRIFAAIYVSAPTATGYMCTMQLGSDVEFKHKNSTFEIPYEIKIENIIPSA